MQSLFQRPGEMTVRERFGQISWSLVALISLLGVIGIVMLYSAAGGSWDPWATNHAIRFAIGMAAPIFIIGFRARPLKASSSRRARLF